MKGFLNIFLMMICVSMQAQDAVTSLVRKMEGAQVSLEYLYVMENAGGVKLHGSGRLIMQGESYFMEGDGIKVWCDGKERWTVDEAAKEAVVENAVEDDFLSSPMLMIARLPEMFSWPSAGERTLFTKRTSPDDEGGVEVAAKRYALALKTGIKSDISDIGLYFDSASTLLGVDMKLKDGTDCSFAVLSMTSVPAGDLSRDSTPADISSFAVSASSFDQSYVITDLR